MAPCIRTLSGGIVTVAPPTRSLRAPPESAGRAPLAPGEDPDGCGTARLKLLLAWEMHHEPRAEVMQSRVDLGLPVGSHLRSPS